MNKEMQDLFYELKQYLVQHSKKWNTLCDIEQYIINLQQQLEDGLRENFKLRDKLEQQRKEYQETYKDVREEIKDYKHQLKEKDKVIDEAIKYIKEHIQYYDDGEYSGYECEIDGLKLWEILERGKNGE